MISGRVQAPALYIVSRAVTEEAENMLMRAGANKVISPLLLGGRHMAHLAMRPNVMEFLEFVTAGGELGLALEEIRVEPGSFLIGKTTSEADIRQRTGATLISIRRASGYRTQPLSGEIRFEAGDGLIAVGTLEQLAELEAMAGTSE